MFKTIFVGAFARVFEEKGALARALLVPVLLSLLLDILVPLYLEGWHLVPYYILSAMLSTIIAVTTHRIVILGPHSVPTWGQWRWTMRETVFIAYVILLGVVFVPVSFLAFIPGLGIFLVCAGLLVAFYLLGRLSLILPAIAVGHRMTLEEAWGWSRGCGWLMFCVVILFPVLLGLPGNLLERLPGGWIPAMFINLLVVVFTISALSMAFRTIVEQNREA